MAFDADAFLAGESQDPRKRAKQQESFDIDSFIASGPNLPLQTSMTELERPTAADVAQTAATAATGSGLTAYGYRGPTGYNPQAVSQALQPLREIIPNTVAQYTRGGVPGVMKAAADVAGLTTVGVPPFASLETAKRVTQVPGAVVETMGNIDRMLASNQLDRATWQKVTDAMNPREFEAFKKSLEVKPGVMSAEGIRKFQLPERLAANPEVAAAFKNLQSQVPGGMSKLGMIMKPAAKIGARVAGPVGLAMTAYDIYNLAPTLAKMYSTGVQGPEGQLGMTSDEMGMMSMPQETDYIDEIRRRAAERALQ